MVDITKEEDGFKKILVRFEEDIKQLRAGRVNLSSAEDIIVEIYGAPSKIAHVAAVSSPDARSIIVKPWDKTILPQIEQAIQRSNIGGAIISEKDQVRISFPPLSEERRLEFVKMLGKKTEEWKIAVRQHREDIWKRIQDEAKEKTISEDQKFSQKEKMEKMVADYNKKIEESSEKKEKEIMTV
jgi:ribosome recycling factor